MKFVELDIVTKSLADAGLKITHQRIVVYQAMCNTDIHPTAEQIYESIKKKNPSISLATVYKTLEIFVTKGLINKVSTPLGTMRYDAQTTPHNHIFVSNTNEIIDYKDDDLRKILLNYLEKKQINNLTITDFKLQIRGDKINPQKGISIT